MADIIQTIKLNLIDTGIIDTGIRVKQGDSGISFIFDVNYAGKKVFEAGNLPTIVFKRSDGVSIIAECTVDNDNYIYTIVGNELEQAGDLLVDLKFTWGGRESTCTARLYVVPDTIGKDVNPSDVYTNTVTIDDINEGVAKTKQYRDEAEQFRNEAEHFTPTGYQQLVTDVDGMKTS
ncbi:MAG: hypothetical protein KBT06_03045, partial [Prevotellaceae bacterium]|nr:hypothetical protein [Candidatus Colivivens equi]